MKVKIWIKTQMMNEKSVSLEWKEVKILSVGQ